jgi:hypothetical protein
MAHGDVEFELEADSSSKSAWWLKSEHEGVAAVEGDSWLEVDGSRRVRHVISGETPYLARQLSVF